MANGRGTPQVRASAVAITIASWTALMVFQWTGGRALTAVAFGGDEQRVAAVSKRYTDSLQRVPDSLVLLALLGVAGASAFWLLSTWWDFGWRSGAQRRAGRLLAGLPILAVGCGAVELIGAMLFADVMDGGLRLGDGWAAVLAGFGQLKWVALAVTAIAMWFTLYGAIRFRRIALDPGGPSSAWSHRPNTPNPEVRQTHALCLSGGGVRAAAFSWGALAAIEEWSPTERNALHPFERIYSVSGGGYAAMALTTSRPLVESGLFYRPAQLDAEQPKTPYAFVRQNCRFLYNAPGGIVRALLTALGSIALNLAAVLLGLVTLAFPVGMLARNVIGSGGAEFDPGTAWPVLAVLALAVPFVILSAAFDRRTPGMFLRIAIGLVGAAGVLATIRIAIPWAAVNRQELLRGSWWRSVVPAAALWLITVAFSFIKPRLVKVAARLGGLITFATLLAVFVIVVGRTIEDNSTWNAPLVALAIAFFGSMIIDFSGVQWWSLHPLYRDRLATTFAMTGTRSEIRSQKPDEWQTWGQLDGQAKPQHVVCAATHRRTADVTGLRSTSFTFSTSGVRMHVAGRNAAGDVTIETFARDTDWFERSIGAAGPHGNRKASVVASAAMSGAAFNSAMGRHSKGSTDSLLAMLNLRLGVWLPNPRFTATKRGEQEDGAFTRPGLRYLLHEVIGHFDVTDPFVHVSDGGHWENLGLVEALRERHRWIVCIDASGDRFHEPTPNGNVLGLATLYEAIDLARIELVTEVRVDPRQYDLMRPNERTGRSARNWMTCHIVYHADPDHGWSDCKCPTGALLFVKALVSDRTPESVLAFANTDRVFPHYPTSDQILRDDQFRSLVGLGQSAMREAIRTLEGWLEDPATVATAPPEVVTPEIPSPPNASRAL